MLYPPRWLRCFGLCLLISWQSTAICAAAEERSGEQIYQQLCASCHGARGEGDNKNYPQPLAGDRSVTELSQYIEKSMPEKEPEKCVGEDAKKVAAYIYDAFYSPIAQARIKPPQIELARLTVRQYRSSIADLVGSFRPAESWTTDRGLRAEYFKNRRMRTEDRVLDRVDPNVKFDFGESVPEPDEFDPVEFAIKWQGSILAPETGDYEFILKTDNGARLWINDNERPLIDGGVKSGKEDRIETIRLLGGRVYPLRLEMFKSKEAKEKRAAISLKWKLPNRAAEVIPQRYLLPQRFPETLIVETPFPPDDRSEGYERGNSISKAWEQATTDAAIEVSAYIATHQREFAGSRNNNGRNNGGERRGRQRENNKDAPNANEDDGEHRNKLREFCVRFAERAFRQPLTDEQKQLFVDRQFAEAGSTDAGLKRVILLVLKSPRFLFRELGNTGNVSYDVAARLSFGMWDSIPDDILLKAAADKKLASREDVQNQAVRMLADPRTRSKLREFLLQWLRVDHLTDISKDSKRFPDFNPAIVSDLRTSLDLFLDDLISSESADFRQLLMSETLYLNGPLAKFYGFELPADSEFQKVSFEPSERAGVLTHPYLMSGFAYTSTTSPIHRGVFISRSVLGRSLRPPPEAVAPLAPDLHADLTTRERVLLQTKPESCQTCHSMINPLGFTLEHFDAVGRFQREEHGKLIDSTGNYLTRAGEQKQFAGVRDLAAFLAQSDETHTALVTQLFHHVVKQPIRAYGIQTPDELRKQFAQHNFNLRKLIVEIVTQAAMTERGAKTDVTIGQAADKINGS
ncbi:MAG: cytochrome c [Planctomycetaceae bacterium]|nr:cytochrome c [Planctomycetaceae bacterium]